MSLSVTCAGSPWRPEELGFREALAEAKELGWHFSRERGTWLATCPDCAEGEEE